MNKVSKLLVVLLVIAMVISLASCSDDTVAKSVDASKPKASATTSYTQNQVNTVSSEESADETDESNKTVIDFGKNTIFDGIGVAMDENGEIICSENDGALWYKVEDERFTTYNKLKSFVCNSLGSQKGTQFMTSVKNYFADKDDALYFVVGINGRGIKSRKSYLLSDSEGTLRLTVGASHNSECIEQTGIVKSNIDFVKNDGQWKIESLTLFY